MKMTDCQAFGEGYWRVDLSEEALNALDVATLEGSDWRKESRWRAVVPVADEFR
jgi:hypothetical protein